MASFELTGKLIATYDTVQRTETFKTREFVVEMSEENNGRVFTSYAKFQCTQDRTSMVDNFNIGDDVKVSFNIRGTKWEKNGAVNYITNLDAWRLEAAFGNASSNQPASAPTGMQAPSAPPAATNVVSDDADDLPF